MGFEYKEDLKELLPVYLDYLVSKGDLEERGDGFYTCPFCNSGNKQKNTAAFHVKVQDIIVFLVLKREIYLI